jgi:hypothetical protein
VLRGLSVFVIGMGMAVLFRAVKDQRIPEWTHSLIQALLILLLVYAVTRTGWAHTGNDIYTVLPLLALIFALAFQLDAVHVEADGAMGLPASGIFALQNLFSASFQSARVSSTYTLALAAGQRIVGILTTAMVTGLFFLRFTQVDSPLRFSRQLCLSSWPDGQSGAVGKTGRPSQFQKPSGNGGVSAVGACTRQNLHARTSLHQRKRSRDGSRISLTRARRQVQR